MQLLFTLLFGFVCHPYFLLMVVLTQLVWSMWIYDADLDRPPLWFHLQMGSVSIILLAACLYSQCRRKEKVKYHPEWSLLNGALFQGQLQLGMSWYKQVICGACVGIIVSLIDESELLAALFLSPSTLQELRTEHGPRGAVPHVAHAHDTMLLMFILHGWVWTLIIAGLLGSWSNAAKLHSAEPIFTIN